MVHRFDGETMEYRWTYDGGRAIKLQITYTEKIFLQINFFSLQQLGHERNSTMYHLIAAKCP